MPFRRDIDLPGTTCSLAIVNYCPVNYFKPLSTNLFVSHAQNFEDVILWRALKHVRAGFYVDVGAQDPVIDSVSLGFYHRGWRGVHVEPVPAYADMLRSARPDERVVEALVGRPGLDVMLYEVPGTGLSTGIASQAELYVNDGLVVQPRECCCLRLSEILEDHKDREIHWLKIDVEGMERYVIESWRPSEVRPWIVMVESTLPNTSEPSFEEWDRRLVELGYEFAYFDALNRFYVSHKRPELMASFGPGPNIFDDFVLSGRSTAPCLRQVKAEAARSHHDVRQLGYKMARLTTLVDELNTSRVAQKRELDARIVALNQKLRGLRASRSWRFSRPLRIPGAIARVLRARTSPERHKNHAKGLLGLLARYRFKTASPRKPILAKGNAPSAQPTSPQQPKNKREKQRLALSDVPVGARQVYKRLARMRREP